MTTLQQFEKIIENIHKLEIVPNDLRAGGDMNKPRVRAELDKLDIHETDDGLGDYMLGILCERYYDYPDCTTQEHSEQALEYFRQSQSKGYAAAGEKVEKMLRDKAEKEKRQAEWEREQEENRVKWKTDNPFFPFRQEFIKEPADNWKIEKLLKECREELGVEPPNGYIAFVKTKDGFKSRGREISEPLYNVEKNKYMYNLPAMQCEYPKWQEEAKQKRYFFVGRSGGGYSEWSDEQEQYVELPWDKYYAYDYENKYYVCINAESGDTEESYPTFTELFKAIWSGVITEDDYIEKLPEAENWKL